MFRHWLVGFGLLALSLGGAANAHADELNGDWARANRFAIGFGVGVASVSMTRFGDFAADGVAMLRRQTTSLTLDGDLKQGAALSTLITLRYYFPFSLMAELGIGALYNWSSTGFSFAQGGPQVRGNVEYHNLTLELPILVGGYYPLIRRLYLYGAVGPDLMFFARSWWDTNVGGFADWKAGTSVGFSGLAGADFLLGERFALGLELRYRWLKSKDLSELDTGFAPSRLGIGQANQPYYLDFSGIAAMLQLRIYAI